MPDPKIIQFPLGLRENLQYHYTGKINVSSGELLAINGTPKTLVVAPGAGFLIFPINIIVSLNFGTIVYGVNTNIDIRHPSGASELMSLAGIIDKAADRIVGAGVTYTPLITNEALILTEATGNPTGGDGNIDIHLWYIKLEL